MTKRAEKVAAKLEAYEIATDTLMLQQDSGCGRLGHTKAENEAYEWLRLKLVKERNAWYANLKLTPEN